MLYLLENAHLGIPVAELYAYCFDLKHMATPFMIIEDLDNGVELHDAFDKFTQAEKDRTVNDFARITHQLMRCRFPSIVSLECEPSGSFKVVGLSTPRSQGVARR